MKPVSLVLNLPFSKNDDKLVVVHIGKYYSGDAINALTEFQEQYFEYVIIRTKNTNEIVSVLIFYWHE